MQELEQPGISTVFITGTGKGFGAALVDAYISRGVFVVALARRPETVKALEQRHGGRCLAILGDVAEDRVMETVSEHLAALDRPIDVLVNNAGIIGTKSHLDETDPTELAELFQVHCVGAFRIAKAVAPFLERADQPMIVNISSRIGSLGRNAEGLFARRGYSYSYRIAKAAQNMLSLCMAEELEPKGIRVLAVHPGQMATVSVVKDAALTAHEAAEQFIAFLDRTALEPRGAMVLRDTYGRRIPW